MAEQKAFTPETAPIPESAPEHVDAAAASGRESIVASTTQPVPTAIVTSVSAPAASVGAPDPIRAEIEAVLSENIAEIYKQLPADRKQKFKQTGEQVALQISGMIRSGILQVKKILRLIRDWLLIIPGVNKFFLEQEAKIKTDKIQELYAREHAPAS